ncbi:DUF423 domain-containing protein [Moraxella canis]|uniref:DUF423 domain-containing protein n=1 Tax=Moraxella canis TaxID=90239 RepID=A0A1S9ZPE7_9GAMM|nr:DUF423 domain-containing protein [Moraxella canis]OOR85354.1 hypothetical protein B0180_00720 [Moraxella canis]
MTPKINWLSVAALNLALGVGLGAFGAHGLKRIADEYALQIWQTATLYLFIHALGLLVIGVLHHIGRYRSALAALLLQVGIVIFSGTLYAMALGAPRWLGAITPIGGTLLIIGWLVFALQIAKTTRSI